MQAIAFKKGIIDALHTYRCDSASPQDELGVHRCSHADRDSVRALSIFSAPTTKIVLALLIVNLVLYGTCTRLVKYSQDDTLLQRGQQDFMENLMSHTASL
jgi:hypothetical protein